MNIIFSFLSFESSENKLVHFVFGPRSDIAPVPLFSNGNLITFVSTALNFILVRRLFFVPDCHVDCVVFCELVVPLLVLVETCARDHDC